MLIWDLILLYYAALAIERVKEGEEMPIDSPPRDVLQIAARDPLNFALANCLRALSIDAVEAAQSSHPGAPMAMAERALAGEFGWTRYVVSEEPRRASRSRLRASSAARDMWSARRT